MKSAVHRLRTPLPKVGIRPIVDGRYGGVRESLDPIALEIARNCAELISKEVKYACGLPAECVIADSCIGGFAEAADCAAKFEREGVGVSLSVTPCWCYGSETMDTNPYTPKAIFGVNGTERPGAVYLAATLSAHAQKGLPCFGIYGRNVQDLTDTSLAPDVCEKLLRFVRAGLAAAQMKGNSYLAMGGVSMGIAGSMVPQDFFETYLGMRVESIDMSEFQGRIQHKMYDQAEFDKAMKWVRRHCTEGKDFNAAEKQRTRAQKEDDWESSVKMALIARDLMIGSSALEKSGCREQARGHNAIAGGFQGQRQWTDYFPNGDFMEAILCSSFDWNGIRQPYVVATENDSLNGASMLLGHLLTGTAQMFSDIRTYWSPEAVKRVTGHILGGDAAQGFLHLINSGPSALDFSGRQRLNGKPACKRFEDITEDEAQDCLKNTTWHPSDTGYFPGGGWSSHFVTEGGMPCTMFRINLIRGQGPVLQIAEGVTVKLPDKVHETLDLRTNPTWPTTWFVPRTTGQGAFRDVYTLMNNWGANHGAISCGHIGADLVTLASMLRIPVDMHNLAEEDVFRPAAWARFGASDLTGADYRACANYGPLLWLEPSKYIRFRFRLFVCT